MANTCTAIATTTVGSGGAASITFSSIPGTYTDLIIKTSLRVSDAVAALDINIKFNTSNADKTILYLSGNGVTASSGSYALTSAVATGASATANTFSNCELYFSNYAGSTNKAFSIDRVTEDNSSTAYAALLAGLWAQTAAITEISFDGNFVQYSTATLYGIKKG